ncbi:hypothetical protein J7T55_000218 [Diaporthe amygdali]|uniref:uncharacterized protein n=1 Tax=Phomopsis amygdali TaxID=1214568 RepID=UPI0022FF0D91|nr:uncharacterized protein J7T55_000218 [Diaporthe amygdali]KAJ0108252.1 hypothetical protein J7T55_000218 [Diaporthe amygdali]
MASDQEQLPVLPEDITTAWLGSKLGHEIRALDLTRIIYGTETKLFFNVSYCGNDEGTERPTQICMKGVFDPDMIAAQPWTITLAQREAEFYTKMAPSIKNMGYPKCWWAGSSERQGIAIMNDLNAEGCTFRAVNEAWSVEEVIRGVEQLAGLHGQYWGAKVEDHPYATNVYDSSMQFLCKDWSSITKDPGRPVIPNDLMDGERFNRLHDKYFATRNPRFRTILHGDTHVANTYLTAEGEPRWLDWSAVHVGSCFHDVAYFMCGALSIEDRRRNEMHVLGCYFDALHRFGGPRFAVEDEEVMIEFRRSFIANCIWVICPYGLQSKEHVDVLCERTVAAWDDHEVLSLIESQPHTVKALAG